MRPSQALKTRVYAWGLLSSIGNRSRLAMRPDNEGRMIPASLTDCVVALNRLDTLGRATKPSVSVALNDLVADGLHRRAGKWKGKVRLFFYHRPLAAKNRPQDEIIVVKSDNNVPPSDSKDDHLRDSLFLHLRGSLVKSVLGMLRKELEIDGIVAESDYKDKVLEILEPALNVVSEAYHQALIVIRTGGVYKEDSSSSSNACMHCDPEPPPPPEKDPLADLTALFPNEHLRPEALASLNEYLSSAEGPDYDPAAFMWFVHDRLKKGPIRPGLIFDRAGLPRDYLRWRKRTADSRSVAAVREREQRVQQDEEMLRQWRDVLEHPEKYDQQEIEIARTILAGRNGVHA